MQFDRRAFLATLGTAAAINAMPSETLADALGVPTPSVQIVLPTTQVTHAAWSFRLITNASS